MTSLERYGVWLSKLLDFWCEEHDFANGSKLLEQVIDQ